MNIPKFNYDEYYKCDVCNHQKGEMNCSIKCLHKLCETCYPKKFGVEYARYKCQFCEKAKRNTELSMKDYIKKAPLKELYENDIKKRKDIYKKYLYKRRENFNSDEEYNQYLEFIEDCIKNEYSQNEIDRKYKQDKKEREQNLENLEKELALIKKKIKDNDPISHNQNKFIIGEDFNLQSDHMEIEEESNQINVSPLKYVEGAKIKIVPDKENEKKAGGYSSNNIKQFLSWYSKAGFNKL